MLQQEIRQLAFERDTRKKGELNRIGASLPRELGNAKGGESQIRPCIDPRQPLIIPPGEEDERIAAEIRANPQAAIGAVAKMKEYFTRGDIARCLEKSANRTLELPQALELAMASEELIRCGEEDSEKFTTRGAIQRKEEIARLVRSMSEASVAPISARFVRAAVATQNRQLKKEVGAELSEEQQAAIAHVLGAEQLSAVVGYAGAGKSTMLNAARIAWERQGYRVLGCALSGKATDGLEKSSGIPSRTLASFEMSWKHGYHQLRKGDVFVIDEAGMVASEQMLEFLINVRNAGAKIVLVGDPEQLTPIEAGKPFKNIVGTVEVAKLTEIRRQKVDWQRQASIAIGNNEGGLAKKLYDCHGLLHRNGNHLSAIARLVSDYVDDVEKRGLDASRLALAYRRTDVHLINQSIRAQLLARRILGDGQLFSTEHGPRTFAMGDHVIFTRHDKELGVRNGTTAVVTRCSNSTLWLRLDGSEDRRLEVNLGGFNALDHSYATTIHRSQGTTVSRSFVLENKGMDRHLRYVAMTRHRSGLALYTVEGGVRLMKQQPRVEDRRALRNNLAH